MDVCSIIIIYTLGTEILLQLARPTNTDITLKHWFLKLLTVSLTGLTGKLSLGSYTYTYDVNVFNILLCLIVDILLVDFIFYFMHRLFHENKFLYNNFHSYHHSPKMMNVLISTYEHPVETLCTRCLPLFIWTLIWSNISTSIWAWIIPALTTNFASITGHCGYRITSRESWFITLLCPFILVYSIIGCAQSNLEHDLHHKYYNCNYSSFLRLWDDYFNTSRLDKFNRPRTSFTYFIYSSTLTMLPFLIIWLSVYHPIIALVTVLLTFLPSSDVLRTLPFWKRLTNDLHITGCNASRMVGQRPTIYGSTSEPQRVGQRPTIYGYHPHGLWSRGGFFAFGINGIHTKFAIRSWLFYVPIVGLLAKWLGCCSADKETITQLLNDGTSVCIALDGRMSLEPNINRNRTGFIKIAKATNSYIVPCLGVGEERLYKSANYFSNASQKPLNIIFGSPIDTSQSNIEELQEQYYNAITVMLKEHGY